MRHSSWTIYAHDLTVVLVNSSLYGGSGGSVPWATTGNTNSAEILLHEMGHGFANLGDEYADPSLINTYRLSNLSSGNLTNSLSSVPWMPWLGYTDALGTVGTYEGGYYRSTGVWRATLDSKMYHLGVAFNAPEKEAFVLACYRTIGDYLSLGTGIPGLVRAVVPDPGLLSFAWSVNGMDLPVSTAYYLDLYALGSYSSNIGIKLITTVRSG